MLAVLRNTLYMYVLSLPSFVRTLTPWKLFSYGGIFELGNASIRWSIFMRPSWINWSGSCVSTFKPSGIVIPTEAEESSDVEGGSGDEGSDDDEDEDDGGSQGETESEDEREKK